MLTIQLKLRKRMEDGENDKAYKPRKGLCMAKRMTSEEFGELAGEASKRLRDFLTKDYYKEDAIPRVRVASSVLSAWTRYQQSESAQEATRFMMARELAQNPEDFKKYLAVACPNVPLNKMIEKR